jgi:hypothetical protein
MIGERYERRTRLRVLKVKGGMVLDLVARRSEPLGHITHWVGRANYMCPGEGCPACMAAIGGRWVGVLPVRVLCGEVLRPTQLLELTGSAWARLDGLLRMDGQRELIGTRLHVSRRRDRDAILLDPDVDGDRFNVKVFPDWALLDALATLYHLPRCLEGWDAATWSEAAKEKAFARLEVAVHQMVV